MNFKKLKSCAEEFENMLVKYENLNGDAKLLHGALLELIEGSKNEKIVSPMERRLIPGDYFFDEGSLRQFADLEYAYSCFVLELSGGETDSMKKLREQIEILRSEHNKK